MHDEVKSGRFWCPEAGSPPSRGKLWLRPGNDAEIHVEKPISARRTIRIEQGGSVVTYSGNPDDAVADFQPVTVHGTLDDGTDVTVINAQDHSNHFGHQMFRATDVIVGAHLTEPGQRYSAIRFRVDDPRWWTHLTRQAHDASSDNTTTLTVHTEDEQVWFEHRTCVPWTRKEYERIVVYPILTLANLATHHRLHITAIELLEETGTQWRPMIGTSADPDAGHWHPDTVVPTRRLDLTIFSTWIELSQHLDGLGSAVAEPATGAIQVQTLTMCAIAEGLHRRLYPETSRLPQLSGATRKRVRRAARAAGADILEQAGFDRHASEDALNEALTHFDELPYRQRLEQLRTSAERAVPGIVADFADWPGAVCSARNQLAHQAYRSQASSDELLNLLIAVGESIPWVLRTVLLQHAGISDGVLRSCYEDSSRYGMYRANVRSLLGSGRPSISDDPVGSRFNVRGG